MKVVGTILGDRTDILFLDKSRICNEVNPLNVPFSIVDMTLEPRYNLSNLEKLSKRILPQVRYLIEI